MTVKEFIEKLQEFNQEAIVFTGDNIDNDVDISWGGPDNCDKKNCTCVCLGPLKENQIENLVSVNQKLEDWAENIVIPRLYKAGILEFDGVDTFELDEDSIVVRYSKPIWGGEYEDYYFRIPYRWYYNPKSLEEYIEDYEIRNNSNRDIIKTI